MVMATERDLGVKPSLRVFSEPLFNVPNFSKHIIIAH